MPAIVVAEVGPVIEVEAAQVVLIGFALSAVLADDEPRHGLEHLTGPHDRPIEDLLRGNRPFARGAGNAHEIRGRIGDIRKIGEGLPAGHLTSAVNVSRRTISSETDCPAATRTCRLTVREVDQAERDVVVARRDGIEGVHARPVGSDGLPRRAVANQHYSDTGQPSARHVGDAARHATCVSLRDCGGAAQPDDSSDE